MAGLEGSDVTPGRQRWRLPAWIADRLRPAGRVSADEEHVARLLGEAWDAFVRLPIEHPADRRDFEAAIHAAQALVLARAGRRQVNGRS